jgi:hypothetical protein
MKSTLPRLLATALTSLMLGAQAADAFTDAMQQAYAPYRAALFRTNGQDQGASAQAVAQARQAWTAVRERFATQPPAPYDRDPRFAATLADVDAVYVRAVAQVGGGRLEEAHETLEQVRELLADLRHRNQVVVFSDAMNAYHAQMEHVLQRGPSWLGAAADLSRLTAAAGALAWLANRLSHEAGPALQGDPAFAAGVRAVEDSVQALLAALQSGDAGAARAALGGLKKPYSQLFLKFG